MLGGTSENYQRISGKPNWRYLIGHGDGRHVLNVREWTLSPGEKWAIFFHGPDCMTRHSTMHSEQWKHTITTKTQQYQYKYEIRNGVKIATYIQSKMKKL